ncbi:MAG: hypothetical protein V3V00_07510 [Saprospiraceae bacterium]
MNINDLEKRIKKAFSNEKAAVNTDDLWASIQNDMPPISVKKINNRWSIVLSAIAIVTIGVGIWSISSENSNHLKSSVFVAKNDQMNDVSGRKVSDSQDIAMRDIITGSKEGQEEDLVVFAKNDLDDPDRDIIDPTISIFNKSNADASIDNDNHFQKLNSSISKRNNNLLNEFENKIKTHNQDNQKISSYSYNSALSNGQNVIMMEKVQTNKGSGSFYSIGNNLASPLSLSQKSRFQPAGNANKDKDGIVNNVVISNKAIQGVQANKYIFKESLLWTNSIAIMKVNFPLPAPPIMDAQRPFWIEKEKSFFFDIGGNLFVGHGSLSLENPDWSDHYNNRKTAETSLVSYGLDAKWGFLLNDAISIHTGLIISKYFKSSAATISSTENITIQDGVVQEIIGMNGTQEVRGEVLGIRQTTSTVNRINKYSYLHIPIGITLTQHLGLLEAHVGLEALMGMNASYSGYIHPNNSEEYDIATDEERLYKDSPPHFLRLAGGIRYPFSDVISISLEASYQYQLGSINTTTYGISESFSGIGIRTSIRIKI